MSSAWLKRTCVWRRPRREAATADEEVGRWNDRENDDDELGEQGFGVRSDDDDDDDDEMVDDDDDEDDDTFL